MLRTNKFELLLTMGLEKNKSQGEMEMKAILSNMEGQMVHARSVWDTNEMKNKTQQHAYEKQIEKLRANQKELESQIDQLQANEEELNQSEHSYAAQLKSVKENSNCADGCLFNEVIMKGKEINEFHPKNEFHGRMKDENKELRKIVQELECKNNFLKEEQHKKDDIIKALKDVIQNIPETLEITDVKQEPTSEITGVKQELTSEITDVKQEPTSEGTTRGELLNNGDEISVEYEENFEEESDNNDDSFNGETTDIQSNADNVIGECNSSRKNKSLQNIVSDKHWKKPILKKSTTDFAVDERAASYKQRIKINKTTHYQIIDDESTVSRGDFVDVLKPPGDIFIGMFDDSARVLSWNLKNSF